LTLPQIRISNPNPNLEINAGYEAQQLVVYTLSFVCFKCGGGAHSSAKVGAVPVQGSKPSGAVAGAFR